MKIPNFRRRNLKKVVSQGLWICFVWRIGEDYLSLWHLWCSCMKKLFMLLALMSCMVGGCLTQSKDSIRKKNNDSIFVDKSMIKNAKMTKYFYLTEDRKKYPIYMSSNGKCFIIRTSFKNGKQYRQYLPEVTTRHIAE